MSDEPVDPVTVEQAESMLPRRDRIHVFSNPGLGMMIGADWDRDDVLEHFREHGVQLAGPIAMEANHGLASTGGGRRLFFETMPGMTAPAAFDPIEMGM